MIDFEDDFDSDFGTDFEPGYSAELIAIARSHPKFKLIYEIKLNEARDEELKRRNRFKKALIGCVIFAILGGCSFLAYDNQLLVAHLDMIGVMVYTLILFFLMGAGIVSVPVFLFLGGYTLVAHTKLMDMAVASAAKCGSIEAYYRKKAIDASMPTMVNIILQEASNPDTTDDNITLGEVNTLRRLAKQQGIDIREEAPKSLPLTFCNHCGGIIEVDELKCSACGADR